jgi:hypothetical protein
VSKKSTGIRLVPVELEIGREATAKSAKAAQEFATIRFARNTELAHAGNMNLDLVAFLESQGFDDGCWKTNRQAISPFGDLHCKLL